MSVWSIDSEIKLITSKPREGIFSGVVTTDILFVKSDELPDPEASYYLLSTVNFENYWMQDINYYIPDNVRKIKSKIIASQHNKFRWKRQNLIKSINKNGEINCPMFSPSVSDGIRFSQGRNRFSLIRELRIEYFPALIPEASLELFEKNKIIV